MQEVAWLFDLDVLIKIALALILGGVIGLEREYHGRPAGLRTNILVCLGATILIIASKSLPAVVSDMGFRGNLVIDPARLAAGIITGIGFLGAGVILKTTDFIRGVTTAACVWLSAALGIVIGMGFYLLALISTGMALFVLIFLDMLGNVIYPVSYRRITIVTKLKPPMEFTEECISILRRHKVRIQDIDYDQDNRNQELKLTFFIRTHHKEVGASLTNVFGALPEVLRTEIH
jgi:putative Mg2+ transporter-C (MgtC) family protein